jgi:hypothetical protein
MWRVRLLQPSELVFVLQPSGWRTQPEGLRQHSPGQRPGKKAIGISESSLKGCDKRLSQPFRLVAI